MKEIVTGKKILASRKTAVKRKVGVAKKGKAGRPKLSRTQLVAHCQSYGIPYSGKKIAVLRRICNKSTAEKRKLAAAAKKKRVVKKKTVTKKKVTKKVVKKKTVAKKAAPKKKRVTKKKKAPAKKKAHKGDPKYVYNRKSKRYVLKSGPAGKKIMAARKK